MAAPSDMDDCLSCRVTGSLTLLGVATYFLNERSKIPRRDLGQRRWLLACAGTFAAAGVWRATTRQFETPTTSTAATTDSAPQEQPWYACADCSRVARAWFGRDAKEHKQARGQAER